MLRSIIKFFKAETTVYSHRHRTIEIIASEKNIDIQSIKNDTKAILESDGDVEAVIRLRKRFHIPLVAAWSFVEKLNK